MITFYNVVPLALGAILGVVIETGTRASPAYACSCDDWVKYVAAEVEGPARAQNQWLYSEPPIYLRVAGTLVMTQSEEPEGPSRIYPHAATRKGGAE